jgi:hypothetical protein
VKAAGPACSQKPPASKATKAQSIAAKTMALTIPARTPVPIVLVLLDTDLPLVVVVAR